MRNPESIPLAGKALQLLFPGFRFGEDDVSEAERLAGAGVGGFCIYGGKASEIADFTRRLQAKADIPLLFCGDYEEGIASHVPEGTRFPSNMGIGASGSERLAYEKGKRTAIEARAIGVRWVLAPVLDLSTQPVNPIVNIRAFGESPELVSRLGAAYMRGLAAGGAVSCGKHFPGHGETLKDSHLELPVLERTRAQLSRRELIPFSRTKKWAGSVMVAHLKIPGLGDAGRVPSSLSRTVGTGLLRRGLKYPGVIVTDALNMRAISRRWTDEAACRMALEAGADVLLVPSDPDKAAASLPAIAWSSREMQKRIEDSFRRVCKLKKDCGLFKDRGLSSPALSIVGCRKHRASAEKMARAALSWARTGSVLSPGKYSYLELGVASPSDWKGGVFLRELKSLGIETEPFVAGASRPVIAASFLRPVAYSGKIKFSPREIKKIESAFRKASDSVLVSFASPYVMDQLEGYGAGLCAFGAGEQSQRAAAFALAGKIKAKGNIPATLGVSKQPAP